jgi:WD40 repeat protein
MQKVEIFAPKSNGIMPRMLKLWVNYGTYYEEISFNPIKDGIATLGNGRDFPILNEGGSIEVFSLVLTKGATSLSERQQVFYKDQNGYKRIKEATVTVLSEGKNAETADEALSRINDMLVSQTCVTTDDYVKKIKELYGDEIKKLKVINNRTSNKIIVCALLNNGERKRFSNWKYELLNKLQPHKLLTVSLEVHEAKSVPVTVEGEIALDAGSGVEIQKEIERAVLELCESEIGLPINSYMLTEKLLRFPQVKRINRLNMKYGREIEDVQQTLTFLNKFSVNFIIS